MMEPKKQNSNPKPEGSADPKAPETKTVAVVQLEKNITDSVLNKVTALEQTGGLQLPPNYSAANALKAAWLVLQGVVDKDKKPALTVCNKDSVANSLFDMVVQGLNPVKKQCYFVVYGSKLTLMRSYLGTIAVTKRLKGIRDVFPNVIYQDDTFEYKINVLTGLKEIVKHDQDFKNIDNDKIVGAYAVVVRDNLPPYVEVMNMRQIISAWEMGSSYGTASDKFHKKFTDEAAKKTVAGRACKLFINTSDDSDILSEAVNRTPEIGDLPDTPYIEEKVEEEIQQNANKELLDINPVKPEPKPIDTSLKDKDNGKAKTEDDTIFAERGF